MPSDNELVYNISVQGIKGAVTDANQLEAALKKLYAILATTTQGTKAWNQAIREIRQATVVHQQMTTQMATGLNQTQTASANASMALLNLNYVIRDSPYFFNNFALGVLAVGNNINPLIDSFARLRQEAGSKSLSTFALLRQALVGGAGISIAFSLVVTAIQSYVFWQSKSNNESKESIKTAEDLADAIIRQVKGVNQLVESYRELNTREIAAATDELNKKLKEQHDIIKKRVDLTLMMNELGGVHLGLLGKIFGYDMDLTEDEIEMLKKIRENMEAIDKVRDKSGRIPQIKAEIAELERLRDLIPPGVSMNVFNTYNKRIKELQEELNKLLGKEKEERRKITGEIHKQAQAMQVLMNVASQAEFIRSDIRNLRGGGDPSKNLPIASIFEGASGKRMKEDMKEFDLALESGKIAANQLGDALVTAFNDATITLGQFIEKLILAIAQMAILRGVTNLLTGGFGGSAATAVTAPVSIPKIGVLNRPSIILDGNIRMNSREFIVQLRNAEKVATL